MAVGRHKYAKRGKSRLPERFQLKNERERQRIRLVNQAYHQLRDRVPIYRNTVKRISKLRILEGAIAYILSLYMQLNLINAMNFKETFLGKKLKLKR
ncbi:hypothetical protein L596_014258 [Steinernema carpocapsae]|uniref:BHLH domain-containing protein n=1 Tax=Steinernema carpocapsae TaxID=34508 RepID=A0A4U5NBB7_STECR|nr:hypothetical protein L596_014258 [Steinernema carpocapsae]